jgi:hypothetical protein
MPKKSFGSPHTVLDYLGRYTHRVALSNNRILSLQNGQIARMRLRVRKNNSKAACTVLTRETLTAPVSAVFHGHFIFSQMPSPAALRMIQSP